MESSVSSEVSSHESYFINISQTSLNLSNLQLVTGVRSCACPSLSLPLIPPSACMSSSACEQEVNRAEGSNQGWNNCCLYVCGVCVISLTERCLYILLHTFKGLVFFLTRIKVAGAGFLSPMKKYCSNRDRLSYVIHPTGNVVGP